MTTPRSLRVAQSMKREFASMLSRDLKSEKISGLVSITDIELTPDCRSARIFLSIFGEPEIQNSTIQALSEQVGFIRGELGRRLGLRFAPELAFKLDDSLERGSRVSSLISKISRGEV